VIARDPSAQPPRPDLGWLRHRSLRRPVAAGGAAEPPPSAIADFFTGRGARPPRPGRPVPTPAPVDLSEPATPAPPRASSSLDLSEPVTPAPTPVPTPAPVPAPIGPPRRPVARVAPRSRTILTRRDPTVTLNLVQSGVGTLTIEAVCSPAVGDIRLGALYQLAGGTSSVVQHATGLPVAPRGSRRPVITGSRGEFDRLTVDLRQVRSLLRMLVYAFSESGSELAWGGTLVTTTFGGARIELPLDLGRHSGPIALLSLYDIDGEFVLRAERELVDGAARDVARLFGYERITWADDRTPAL
jgi:hypothetical protein